MAHPGSDGSDTATVSSESRSRPTRQRAESVIDANARFEGTITAEQDLRIMGSVTGEITCEGVLTVDTDASAEAKIETQGLEVYGTVEGDIRCAGPVHLAPTAIVNGTLKAALLVIEEGATVNGRIEVNYTGKDGVVSNARTRTPAPRRRKAASSSSAVEE